MGTRRRARAFAVQALFQADLREFASEVTLDQLWAGLMDSEGLDKDEEPPAADEMAFATKLVEGVLSNRGTIDELIGECSTNWRLARMPLVDRNILRVAAFELMHRTDIPGSVSVNEAIELAKTYGTKDSRAFVNGIVDRMGRQLGRLTAKGDRRG